MNRLHGRKLRHDEILPFLNEIGEELKRHDATAEMYIGGGAAIAVRHGPGARELTDDVDGAFRKNPVVLEVAARIAAREGLQADWVNDKFTGFIPGAQEDTDATTHQLAALTVRFASDRFLLAMKMQAGRAKDVADTRLLIRRLGLHRASDIAELTCDLYGDAAVPAVRYDDMRFHALRMLDGIRSVAEPRWPRRDGSGEPMVLSGVAGFLG